MEWRNVEPLKSERLIDEYERKVGYTFPASFRACVIQNNGGKPQNNFFDGAKTKRIELNGLNSFNLQGLFTVWEDEWWYKDHHNAAEMDALFKRYVPFARAQTYNRVAFDVTDNSVVFIDHKTLDVQHVAPDFESFLSVLYDTGWKFVKPLQSESLIGEYERKIGYTFPASFRRFVIDNNGGTPKKEVFDTEESEERVFNWLLSFNPDDKCSIWNSEWDIDGWRSWGIDMKAFVKRYIPFADDPFGNTIAFDATDDSVVFIDHESMDVEYVASDFETFINSLYEYVDEEY